MPIEGSDQTARMRRLILVSDLRKYQLVHFAGSGSYILCPDICLFPETQKYLFVAGNVRLNFASSYIDNESVVVVFIAATPNVKQNMSSIDTQG